jgi:hypothetical protein
MADTFAASPGSSDDAAGAAPVFAGGSAAWLLMVHGAKRTSRHPANIPRIAYSLARAVIPRADAPQFATVTRRPAEESRAACVSCAPRNNTFRPSHYDEKSADEREVKRRLLAKRQNLQNQNAYHDASDLSQIAPHSKLSDPMGSKSVYSKALPHFIG